jgi:hypothetical protein
MISGEPGFSGNVLSVVAQQDFLLGEENTAAFANLRFRG